MYSVRPFGQKPGLNSSGGIASAGSSLLNGLVAYWPLSEASGSRADLVGGFTLTDNNTVTSVAKGGGAPSNLPGTVAQFTAANSEYLNTAGTIAGVDANLTLSGWVYYDSNTNNRTLCNDADGDFFIRAAAGGSNFSFFTRAFNDFKISTVAPVNNQWYFVLCYHDATNDQIGIAIDGAAAQTAATGGPNGAINTFLIGARTAATEFMDGRISSVGVWNRVLTVGERTNLYNGGAAGIYPFTGL